jgi:hypothetical protein
MGIAPPLFGLIFERSGSYQPVYWILCIAALAGTALYFVVGPYRFSVGPPGPARAGAPAIKASAA